MLLLSLLVLCLAIVVYRRFGKNRILVAVVLTLIPVWVVLTALEIGLNAITGEGLNDAVFYHLKTGLGGGDVTQYAGQVIAAVAGLLAIAGAAFWLRGYLAPARGSGTIGGDLGAVALIALAFGVHPVPQATTSYLMRFQSTPQLTEGFYTPEITAGTDQRGKNLILLYLESTERTYADLSRFDNLMPNLMALEPRSIHFTDLSQTIGTGFTIGGMVASQGGSPLILSGGENSMQVNRFLAGATCLGDLLAGQGYDLNYLGGASLEFAGTGAFYETHGYGTVQGLDELLPTIPDPAYRAEWGLQDDTLFALARQKLEKLSAHDRPFVLTILTLDTHHPHGHGETNRSCQDMKYQDGSNKLLNSVMCDDKLAAEFVQEVLDGPLAENTVVVVMSDHLALGNDATDILNSGPRRNLAMIFDPATPEGQRVDRPGTRLDMGPTILSVMGYGIDRMGFGVNLLGTSQTLPEELGVAADDSKPLDQHLLGYQTTYARLWDYPDLGQGLRIDLAGPTAILGETQLGAPLLAQIDEAGAIGNVALYDARAETGLTAQFLNFETGTPFLWVDQCSILGNLSSGGVNTGAAELCLATGRKAEVATVRPVAADASFEAETLLSDLQGPVDTTRATAQIDALRAFGQKVGSLPFIQTVSGVANDGRGVLLHSSSFTSQVPSLIRRRTNDTMTTGEDWFVPRGLSLVGITSSGCADFLTTFDTCGENPTPDMRPWLPILTERWADFSNFVILAHDSGYCGSDATTLAPILGGLDLPLLQNLKMRQPYIAVIEKDGTAHEYQNGDNSMLRVYMEPAEIEEMVTVHSGPIFGTGDNETSAQMSAVMTQNNDVVADPVLVSVSSAPSAPASVSDPTETEATSTVLPDPVDPAAVCISPSEPPAPPSRKPISAGMILAGTEIEPFIDFGPEWWSGENAGRWASAASASFMITNASGTEVDLLLDLVPYQTDSSEFEILIGGTAVLAAIDPNDGLHVPVPAGFDGQITLSIKDTMGVRCPASLDRAPDNRRLSFMLQNVSVVASESSAQTDASVPAPFSTAIAHAGGKLGGEAITDSITSLDANIGLFSTFEIDLNWTTDGQLVCIHDWEDSYRYRSGQDQNGPVSLTDFRAMLDTSPDRPRNCDLETLGQWMMQKGGATIVTDAKEHAGDVNQLIATTYPELRARIVPQAYQPEEINQFRDQGYPKVIWTLYQYGGTDDDVLREVASRKPDAVTLPIYRALGTSLVRDLLDQTGTPVYVHTVNEPELAACLKSIGVAGIYSDSLGTSDWQTLPEMPATCVESFGQ